MKRRWLLLPVLVFLAAVPEPSYCASPIPVDLIAPRPFGFVIGDQIPHRITVEVEETLKLKAASLPSIGPLNYWLELREATFKRTENHGKARYTIDLLYQTFYAPREVETLAIPGFTLIFEARGQTFEANVDPWHFTMSVIRELSVAAEHGEAYRRPDDPPDFLDTRSSWTRLLMLTGALALSLGLSTYWFGYLPWSRRGRIFHQALLELGRSATRNEDSERLKAAFSTIHEAFNKLNGRPLFSDRLSEFLAEHPGYRQVESQIADFFETSNALFFSGVDASDLTYSLDKAIDLCRICRAIERGIR